MPLSFAVMDAFSLWLSVAQAHVGNFMFPFIGREKKEGSGSVDRLRLLRLTQPQSSRSVRQA